MASNCIANNRLTLGIGELAFLKPTTRLLQGEYVIPMHRICAETSLGCRFIVYDYSGYHSRATCVGGE